MSIHKKLQVINKDISKDFWNQNQNFPKRNAKSEGRTSPLVTSSVKVEIVDGKTVCTVAPDRTDQQLLYQRIGEPYSMSRNYAPETRQRMRPWLESQINRGCVKGLEWLDPEQKIFKVPWKNVGNREWSEDDGMIFKEWAVHTGRFREGVDTADWPTWKTRFRCALTKLPEIKELKQFNRLDGRTDEPYRVYQFVPRSADSSMSRYNSPYSEDSQNYSPSRDMEYMEPTIPTTVNSHQSDGIISNSERLPSDIRDMETGDLMQLDSSEIKKVKIEDFEVDEPMEIPNIQEDETQTEITQKAKKQIPFRPSPLTMPPDTWTLDPSDYKLYITIKYKLKTVYEQLCANQVGCHIFYDKKIILQNAVEYEQMYGPREAQQIALPTCNVANSQQQRLTQDLLSALDRGLVVQVKNGNIYATRKCRCRMYISKPTLDNKCEIIKLERYKETLVFDLHGYFKTALEKYVHQRGPKPSVEVIVGFGQGFTLERESINNLLVSATIVHTEAHNLLTRILCTSPTSPNLSVSRSDPLDRIVDVLQFQ